MSVGDTVYGVTAAGCPSGDAGCAPALDGVA